MFTGMFGACLGLANQTRRRWLRIIAPIFGLILAIGAHMLNNALPLLGALAGELPRDPEPLPNIGFLEAFLAASLIRLVIFLPFVVIAALLLWRSGVWERRVIREELAAEIGRSVTPSEYQEIVRDRAFRTRRINGFGHASPALVNAQNELAFRKRRVRDDGNDPEHDFLANGWRDEIERLRAAKRAV
jgi:hypothetical protein